MTGEGEVNPIIKAVCRKIVNRRFGQDRQQNLRGASDGLLGLREMEANGPA